MNSIKKDWPLSKLETFCIGVYTRLAFIKTGEILYLHMILGSETTPYKYRSFRGL